MEGRDEGQANPRARIAMAAGAAVILVAIVVVVAVTYDGGTKRAPNPPDPRCIDAWNDDATARAYGRHNFSYHLYKGALVTFLDADANEVGAGEGGFCAVIFPAKVLDAEPFAAGQILRGKRWSPISSLDRVQLTRVAELQVLAAGTPNTTLDVQGMLTPL
jgi:hypothetical protein